MSDAKVYDIDVRRAEDEVRRAFGIPADVPLVLQQLQSGKLARMRQPRHGEGKRKEHVTIRTRRTPTDWEPRE